VTLGLLCGGRGRRLGLPKERLIDASGVTLLERQLTRLSSHFRETLLLAGRQPKQVPVSLATPFRQSCDPWEYSGEGPLAGLCAGLRDASTEWLALVPVDAPHFPVQALLQAPARLAGTQLRAIGFLDAEGSPQWLPGVYHRSLLSSLQGSLAAGERSLGRWMRRQPHRFLEWQADWGPMERAFTNLNSPEQALREGLSVPSKPALRKP
jgi:molybdopterin-guanine dinucleotide biosynthesis protein A